MILDEKHALQQKLFRQFAETEFTKELQDKLDLTGDFDWDIHNKMAKYGFMGVKIPKEYGGAGCDNLSYALLVEEFARVNAVLSIYANTSNSLGGGPLMIAGSEEQKKKYLPAPPAAKPVEVFTKSKPTFFAIRQPSAISFFVRLQHSRISLRTRSLRSVRQVRTHWRSSASQRPGANLRSRWLTTRSSSSAPAWMASNASKQRALFVPWPSGKSMTVQTLTGLLLRMRAHVSTSHGFTQTDANPAFFASAHSFRTASFSPAGFRNVWSMKEARLLLFRNTDDLLH